jgi:hypothetical protein
MNFLKMKAGFVRVGRRCAVPSLVFLSLFGTVHIASGKTKETQDIRLREGGQCDPGPSGGAYHCHEGLSTKRVVKVHQIDGKRADPLIRFGDRKFALSPGQRTVTVSYNEISTATVIILSTITFTNSPNVDVSFVAEPGHSYRLDAVVTSKSNSGVQWYPLIFDVTQKGQEQLVAPVPKQ